VTLYAWAAFGLVTAMTILPISGWASGDLTPVTSGHHIGRQMIGSPTCDEVDLTPESTCITSPTTCNTVSVEFNRTDSRPVRGYSVTCSLSAELALCVDLNSIVEGDYLSDYGMTHFEVLDNLDNTYTVDCAILGEGCGPSESGTLFTIAVGLGTSDGTGRVSVTRVRVRDCNNIPIPAFPGDDALITVDTIGPAPVTDISAAQVTTGNDDDGTTRITIDFTAPSDAVEIEVYRAGYGDYPEYDDGSGSVPSPPSYPPGAPWQLTSVAASGQDDETTERDFWYFVVFTKDACGNVSAVSNMTEGTLNYHLGDVTNGITNGQGDNLVNVADISLLGAHYGITIVHNDPVNYLDVGPTTDGSVNGRPLTDNQIQFEDLIIFAINFGAVSARSISVTIGTGMSPMRRDNWMARKRRTSRSARSRPDSVSSAPDPTRSPRKRPSPSNSPRRCR